MSFKDRSDAGRRLAARLAKYKDQRPAIFALPRGGAPVSSSKSRRRSKAPLDLVLVRKIGAPASA